MSFDMDLSPQNVDLFYQQSPDLNSSARLVRGRRFAFLDSKVLNEFRVLPGSPDPRAWFFAAKRHATFGLVKQGFLKQEVSRPFVCPKTFGMNERCFICELGDALRPVLDQKALQAFYPSVAVFMNALLKDPQSGAWNQVILSVSKSVFQQIDEIWRKYPDRPLMHPTKGFVLTARIVPGTKVFVVEAHLDRQEPVIDEKILENLANLSEEVRRLVDSYAEIMSLFRDEFVSAVQKACEAAGLEFPPGGVAAPAGTTSSAQASTPPPAQTDESTPSPNPVQTGETVGASAPTVQSASSAQPSQEDDVPLSADSILDQVKKVVEGS